MGWFVDVVDIAGTTILGLSTTTSRKGKIKYKGTESANADKRTDQLEDGPEHPNLWGYAKNDIRIKR
jgi:hypothetical protein